MKCFQHIGSFQSWAGGSQQAGPHLERAMKVPAHKTVKPGLHAGVLPRFLHPLRHPTLLAAAAGLRFRLSRCGEVR